jgi:5'-nucleotidase
MRILITNDDGIDSPGLHALVDALSGQHELIVVAPDGNRSGVSHAITTRHAVTIEHRHDLAVTAYACSGTPADCVFLACEELFPVRPQLVVSGINHGPNLADDVNYSGTVAAAIEGSLLGVPSIAVSLGVDPDDLAADRYWAAAATVTRDVVERAKNHLRDPAIYWNLNVPNIPLADQGHVAITHLGRKRIAGRMIGEGEGGERRYFRAWENPFANDAMRMPSDIAALQGGHPSLTPLLLDRTAFAAIPSLALG